MEGFVSIGEEPSFSHLHTLHWSQKGMSYFKGNFGMPHSLILACLPLSFDNNECAQAMSTITKKLPWRLFHLGKDFNIGLGLLTPNIEERHFFASFKCVACVYVPTKNMHKSKGESMKYRYFDYDEVTRLYNLHKHPSTKGTFAQPINHANGCPM